MARILLQNGCSYTVPNVFPKNWKTITASLKKAWYITYRYHDPAYKERYPEGYPVMVKGMNIFADLKQRQSSTQALLNEIKDLLELQGYNPISQTAFAPAAEESEYIIHPKTPLLDALQAAKNRLARAKSTLDDIQVTIRGFGRAAIDLGLDRKPISEVKRVNVITILDRCAQLNDKWSPARFNKYKANLSMVWVELREVEAVDSNIISDIQPKKGIIKKKRETLSPEERQLINTFLHTYYRRFWIFLHTFFHSGSRETEMMRITGKDVELTKRQVKYLVLKGNSYEEVYRPIKEIAVPFWEMALEGCGPDDHVFSEGLEPGPVAISPRQITRRWASHVKGKKKSRSTKPEKDRTIPLPKLEIDVTADFYSLKHSNLDEVTALLDMAAAAKLAAHKSTKMVNAHYAVGEDQRSMDRIRSLNNAFA